MADRDPPVTPSSGTVSFGDINSSTGTTTDYDPYKQIDFSWLKNNAKTAIGGSVGGVTSFADVYGKKYYQNNTKGNCDNTNCATASSSGNKQCQNCTKTPLSNCANCDTQKWLQPNCNCACTYNCNQVSNQTYNCNCNCDIVCACACSDRALKTNIRNITNAMDIIDRLQGVYYDWNQRAGDYGKYPGKRVMGVLANDTKKELPEVVGQYKDVLTVDPEGFHGLFIEALKELKSEIESIKKV